MVIYMKTKTFDKTELNNVLGLSCIENFFLYALKNESYDYKHLYYLSYLSLCDIASEFINNGVDYASFYKITRLQELAKNHNLIVMKYFRNTNFYNNINDCDYTAITVKPEYIKEKYKTELWRNDHYILISQIDSEKFHYLNDNPRDSGNISFRELENIYAGEMIGFTIKNHITEKLKKDFTKNFIDSIIIIPMRFKFNISDLLTARDILGILRILRKRMYEYCVQYITVDFYEDFLTHIDKTYSLIEYMRLRKSSDLNKINETFEEIQEKDIELLAVLADKMEEYFNEL